VKLNDDLIVNSNDLDKFQKIINVQFTEHKYLIQALTHGSLFSGDSEKSAAFKKANRLESKDYEKLEFLGDSVLGLIVAEYAYHDTKIEAYTRLTGKSIEGVSTNLKKILVSNESLKSIAEKISLRDFVLCEAHVNIDGKLPDIIEALIGAIYLDNNGYAQAKGFVHTFFDLDNALEKISHANPKGKLKEIFDRDRSNFEYKLLSKQGMDHDINFTVELLVEGKIASTGSGKRIKDAEKDAAETYLNSLV
jgi:ribonuclease-3